MKIWTDNVRPTTTGVDRGVDVDVEVELADGTLLDGAVTLAPAADGRPVYEAFGSLAFDRPEEHVLRITLSTPGKLNAVGHEAHGQLAEVWREIDRDPETRPPEYMGTIGSSSEHPGSRPRKRSDPLR